MERSLFRIRGLDRADVGFLILFPVLGGAGIVLCRVEARLLAQGHVFLLDLDPAFASDLERALDERALALLVLQFFGEPPIGGFERAALLVEALGELVAALGQACQLVVEAFDLELSH